MPKPDKDNQPEDRSLVPRPKGELAKGGEEPKSTELVKRGLEATIKPRLLCRLSGHFDRVSVVAWSPDGTRLASGKDKAVSVWDVERVEVIHTLKGHAGIISAIAWSPDGSRLASGDQGTDTEVRVWDGATGQQLHRLSEPDGVSSISWSPDESRLAVGTVNPVGFGTSARVWDAGSGKELHALVGPAYMADVTWANRGGRVSCCGMDGTVRAWDPENGEELHQETWWYEGLAQCVAWNAIGTRFASGHEDARVRVWDWASGKALYTLEVPSSSIRAVAWSPDGTRLASCGGWGVSMWNSESAEELLAMDGENFEPSPRGLSWSPDATRLAICHGGTIEIWSISE